MLKCFFCRSIEYIKNINENTDIGIYKDNKVVIKKINKKSKKEIYNYKRLYHPSVMTVYYYDNNIIIYEYIELGCLKDIIFNSTVHLDNINVVNIIIYILEGINFLHTKNIIHGNLKLTNILVNNSFNIKITDLDKINQTPNKIKNFRDNYYKSYETYINKILVKESDIYSFSMIIYSIIYFKEPFYEYEEDIINRVMDIRNPLRPKILFNTQYELNNILETCWNTMYYLRMEYKDISNNLHVLRNKLLKFNNNIVIYNYKLQNILSKMFPKEIVLKLLYSKKIFPINYNNVGVLFMDICGYTELCIKYGNEIMVNTISKLYNKIDDEIRKYNLIKIGNVGDAYIICTNLDEDTKTELDIVDLALCALGILEITSTSKIEENEEYIKIRIGIDYGNVIAHVMGNIVPKFSLFGNVVNTASRMETNAGENKILITKNVYQVLTPLDSNFNITFNKNFKIKGIGYLDTYYLNDYTIKKQDKKYIRRNSSMDLNIILSNKLQKIIEGFNNDDFSYLKKSQKELITNLETNYRSITMN